MARKTALESSSVATCATKSVLTSASMSERVQYASKSATLRRGSTTPAKTGRVLVYRTKHVSHVSETNASDSSYDDSSGGSHVSTHDSIPTARPKRTDSVRSPKSQSTPDTVNPSAPEPVPVFTDDEITDLMESHLEFPEEEYSKEIEDRLYPITKSDVRKQLERIRKRQINPTHEEILRSLDLSQADSHLLLAPADIEDETLWLKWFADTLEKCDEARRASRDFNHTRKHPLARVSWIDPNPYAVLDMEDLTEVAEHADGEDSGSTSFEDEKLPSDCVTYLSDIPTLRSGVRQSENPKCSDKFWDELPLDYPHSTPTASTQARLKSQQLRSLHRRSAKIDPTYCSDLLEGNPPSVRLLCRLTRLCQTRSRSDADPFIQAYVNNMKATTLIDTGATSSFVSATFWHKLGCPTLSHPRSSFVSADSSQLEMLGRIKLTINLAGRKVLFPFWVMSTALTDCIVGIDLLRQMGAIINLNDNTLSIDGCDELISHSPLSPAQQETHPTGPVTVATSTQIPPRSFQWIACSAGSDLPTLTTILVEPTKSALLHVAAALYRTNPSRTVLLEVANPSDSPIHLPAHAILGTWMALPKDHSESTIDSHDSRAQTANGKSSQTTDEPRRVLTQIGGPGVVCPVQSETAPTNELPIDWTESSLSIEQRELLRKTLMKFSDIFVDSSKAPGRTHLIEFSIDTGNNPPIRS
ncbi:hypothetical protein AeRB84_018364, partial [Aphanomyces euteiches]